MPSPASALSLRGCGSQTSHEETTRARHLPPCLQTRRGSKLRKCKNNNSKRGENNQSARHQLCHRPPPTHLHHLKKKISSKVPQGAKPASPRPPGEPGGVRHGEQRGAAGSSGEPAPPSPVEPCRWRGRAAPGTQGTRPPARQPGRPSPCFPVPVVLRGRKPASAARRRDPPSSRCPKENATRRCSRSRPRRHQRGVPTRDGWGEGRQGRGSSRSPGGSPAGGPCVPSRRTRTWEAARGYGEEL